MNKDELNKYGEGVVVRKYKYFSPTCAVAVLCNIYNHKWWRIRKDGLTLDLGIKTFSNIDNIVFEDGEIFERK